MTPQNLMLLPLSTLKLSIGCLKLDHCLGGGILCNSITELVGESGSGKTQLCLQLTSFMLSSRFVRPFEWAELQLLLLERDRSGYSRWSDELLHELFYLNRALPEFSGVFTFVKIQTLLVLAFAEPNL
ncbi:hypothetical protein L3X38_010070 [Prunus dulcis]|uniref:RecA family profile 1 domain-containing protein n=1 Tax=Prunus dulcis TaxID=3755 RepID=A0AAD4WEU1_PRUDU|nr:hypothetical protein L3X38_010070 [Prunus dulcis]